MQYSPSNRYEAAVKSKDCIPCILILCYAFLFPVSANETSAAGASTGQRGEIEVVCTTTLLSSIVDAVGGELVETHTVIPSGMCPGHFDLSPGEARKLFEAKLLLHHGYEQFLRGMDFGGGTNILKVDVKGNWMIPDVQVPAVWKVAGILSGIQPALVDDFSSRAEDYAAAVHASSDSLLDRLSGCSGAPVVCSVMNRDFVEWIGLQVVAEYPRDEDISIKTMQEIIVEGRRRGVKLVIDNKQSSGKVGRTIADNLNVPLVVLTNFPETAPSEVSGYPYIRTLTGNCASVIEALEHGGQEKNSGAP